jgi:hypothetical protein
MDDKSFATACFALGFAVASCLLNFMLCALNLIVLAVLIGLAVFK